MTEQTEAEQTPAKDPLNVVRENREDFMKRWFAIALSVGFATAISNMAWLRDGSAFEFGRPIDWEQVKQLARLFAAVIATIMSWEGYLLSISTKPLGDERRFYIDVLLVFLYLFLLLTSKFPYFWLWIHAGAFVLYNLWDFLSIKEHPRAYINCPPALPTFAPTRREVYWGAIVGDDRIYHGPLITLLWPIYFVSLPITYHFLLPEEVREKPSTTIVYAVLVIYGLLTYRRDKKNKVASPGSRLKRVVVSALTVIGAAVILRSAC